MGQSELATHQQLAMATECNLALIKEIRIIRHELKALAWMMPPSDQAQWVAQVRAFCEEDGITLEDVAETTPDFTIHNDFDGG